jgi:hypothetical protein
MNITNFRLKYPENAKKFKLPADIYAGIDDEEDV